MSCWLQAWHYPVLCLIGVTRRLRGVKSKRAYRMLVTNRQDGRTRLSVNLRHSLLAAAALPLSQNQISSPPCSHPQSTSTCPMLRNWHVSTAMRRRVLLFIVPALSFVLIATSLYLGRGHLTRIAWPAFATDASSASSHDSSPDSANVPPGVSSGASSAASAPITVLDGKAAVKHC